MMVNTLSSSKEDEHRSDGSQSSINKIERLREGKSQRTHRHRDARFLTTVRSVMQKFHK